MADQADASLSDASTEAALLYKSSSANHIDGIVQRHVVFIHLPLVPQEVRLNNANTVRPEAGFLLLRSVRSRDGNDSGSIREGDITLLLFLFPATLTANLTPLSSQKGPSVAPNNCFPEADQSHLQQCALDQRRGDNCPLHRRQVRYHTANLAIHDPQIQHPPPRCSLPSWSV